MRCGRFFEFLELVSWVLILSACGKGTLSPVNDAPDFQRYLDHFQAYSVQYGHDVPPVKNLLGVTFGPTQDADVAGLCIWGFLSGRQILINKEQWKDLDDLSRESLVFHELGHCALNRAHNADLISGAETGLKADDKKYPKSLMNPVFVNGTTYKKLQDYYLRELFGDI
jgi:hypothetical protein